MIRMNIVSAPDDLRDQLRHLTRMKLIRMLAAWRPDLTRYRDVTGAYKIALKSLARRYLELTDEITDLDVMIKNIVDHLAPDLITKEHARRQRKLAKAGGATDDDEPDAQSSLDLDATDADDEADA